MNTYFNVRNDVHYKALVEKNKSGYTVQCFENDRMVATTMVEDPTTANTIAEGFVGSSDPQLLNG